MGEIILGVILITCLAFVGGAVYGLVMHNLELRSIKNGIKELKKKAEKPNPGTGYWNKYAEYVVNKPTEMEKQEKNMKSSLDKYNEIAKECNYDQDKINEVIDNRLEEIKQEKNEWGKYMMTNFWSQVKRVAKGEAKVK